MEFLQRLTVDQNLQRGSKLPAVLAASMAVSKVEIRLEEVELVAIVDLLWKDFTTRSADSRAEVPQDRHWRAHVCGEAFNLINTKRSE